MQANWQVTVEGKTSVNNLAGVFNSQISTVQESGVASPTHVAQPVADSTEVYKTLKESVEQAVEPDQCVLKVKTQRQRYCRVHTHTAGCERTGR